MSDKTPKKNSNSSLSESFVETMLARLQQVGLSESETSSMRSRLSVYAALHEPAAAQAGSVLSPFTIFSFSTVRSYLATYPRIATGAAFVLLLLIGTTGASFASQTSLPGDALYPVKVSLVEPLQGALQFTPVAQAQWQTELASRRLSEAVALATQGTLSTSTQAYLAGEADKHVAKAEAAADSLSASGDSKDAVVLRNGLEANLTAHAEFLSLITPQLAAQGDATTTESVFALLTKVQEDRASVAGSTSVPPLPSLALNAHADENGHGSASSTDEVTIAASSSVAIQGQLQQDEEALAVMLNQNPALLKRAAAAIRATASSSTAGSASTTDASNLRVGITNSDEGSTGSSSAPGHIERGAPIHILLQKAGGDTISHNDSASSSASTDIPDTIGE